MPPLRWPLPALLAWGLAWLLFLALRGVLPVGAALLVACALPVALSPLAQGWWRRVLLASGFPLALLMSGGASVPPWVWLAPLALLLLVYPLGAWRDAPLFPTPHGALIGLYAAVPLAVGAQVLDAGCGLGDGLIALRQAYPRARLDGVERSRLLSWLCRLRCPWARVRRGDIWTTNWSRYQLVYLFQRPESMPRAARKALSEMAAGSWLVSLEFPVPGAQPHAQWKEPAGRHVWAYRVDSRFAERPPGNGP